MFGVVLIFGLVITSCSTFMSVQVNPGSGFTYDILGYVGSDFNSYDEAFAAAKNAYPAAVSGLSPGRPFLQGADPHPAPIAPIPV